MKQRLPHYTKCCVMLLAALLCSVCIFAQEFTVKGRITDAVSKQPVAGATIALNINSKLTTSDANGEFSIAAKKGDQLHITFIGYEEQSLKINDNSFLELQITPGSKSLNDVVVTALGIKKEVKKLGYSIQEVKGEDLIKAREPNAVNSLVGKVAGLTVAMNSEMMRAPDLILRGRGINLFVVDGVPINSDTWNISPDDIETFTILKGATASALYGSRGLNGAIMITTKRGSKDKRGYSIEFNSSTMIDNGFNAIPKVQDLYGPGDHGKYAFVDGKGGGTNDADYDVWGPKFEGQPIPQYDSPVDPVTGVRSGTPWVARGTDNLKRFLTPGLLSTNNISVSSKTDKYDMRFSMSHTYQKGIVPNMKMNLSNFNITAGYNFSEKVRLESYLNYNRQFTPNFPDVNYGPNSLIYNIVLWGGADWNIDDMRNYWQPGKEGVQSIYAEYQRYHNPYFVVYEWLRGHYKTDVNGSLKLTYKIGKNFELMGRTQATTYDLLRTEKMPYSAHPYGREEGRGDYREDRRSLFENNTDVLLSYNNANFANGFSLRASVGGNIRSFKYNSSYVTTDYLNVPGLYTFANTRNPLKANNFSSNMLVASAYGFVDLGYKDYLTLSFTGRYDKLSTLPKGNNVYFYPSVSLSTVISDYTTLPSAISFLKLRGSYANVKGGLTQAYIGSTPGNSFPIGYGQDYSSSYDGPTFQNSATYSTPIVYNNLVGAYYTDIINNPSLKPFSSTVYEGGIDIRFLKNRIGLDVTYFLTNDGPGIFTLPLSLTTGYTGALQNGITTKKTGWEVSLTGNPVRLNNGFRWDVTANWSTFKETYKEFYGDVKELSRFVRIGDRVDQLIGSSFVKTPEGVIINDAGGRPIRNPQSQFLGYTNPDWVWSFINTFTYKSFRFSFQVDGRVGGKMINYIQQQTFRGGRHINTVEGKMGEARYQDYLGNKSWVGDGVVVNNNVPIEYDNFGNVTNYDQLKYGTNSAATFLQDYISFYYNTNEANLISKSFAKLREVTFTYTLPAGLFKNSFIKNANVSLVGRNLLYFAKYKDVDIDQYASSTGSSGLQTPTTKRYGININITF